MSYDPDEMMLELFRAEVESHSDSLTNSLLKLEQDPETTNVLDGMMRAAHSIKGAARIVRVDAAVDVAHVMEDCFVAAQRGELVFDPSGIDVLLRSVDLLVQISEASKDPKVDWAKFAPTLKATVLQLQCVLKKLPLASQPPGTPAPASAPVTNTPVGIATPQVPTSPKPTSQQVPSVAEPIATAVPERPSLVLPEVLDVTNAEGFRVQLIALLDRQPCVTLDLSSLKDLDAVGLAWLHSATKYAKTKTRQLTIAHASPSIGSALEALGVTTGKDA